MSIGHYGEDSRRRSGSYQAADMPFGLDLSTHCLISPATNKIVSESLFRDLLE